MRHGKKIPKLGHNKSQRKQLLRNLVSALIRHERIETTLAKAKGMQRYADRMITYGKRDIESNRKAAWYFLCQEGDLMKKLFAELGPRYVERTGGYTRVLKSAPRRSDGAKMAIIEYVDNPLPPLRPPPSVEILRSKVVHSDLIKAWFKDKKLEAKNRLWEESQKLPYPKPRKPSQLLSSQKADSLAQMVAAMNLTVKLKSPGDKKLDENNQESN